MIKAFALLTAFAAVVNAQEARYVTVVVSALTTNQIQIADFETGELVTLTPAFNADAIILKNGASIDVTADYPLKKTIVQGPATFIFPNAASTSGSPYPPVLATVKITPASFPPDKTLIIAPTTNQFQVTLETSTNLVSWDSATNGAYGSPDAARFFRIHLQQTN